MGEKVIFTVQQPECFGLIAFGEPVAFPGYPRPLGVFRKGVEALKLENVYETPFPFEAEAANDSASTSVQPLK